MTPRSSRQFRISFPTAPVAPTIPTVYEFKDVEESDAILLLEMIDLGVNAVEVVPLFCLLMAVFTVIGANAFTFVVVDRVVAATNPNADQIAVLVNFIVSFLVSTISLQGLT